MAEVEDGRGGGVDFRSYSEFDSEAELSGGRDGIFSCVRGEARWLVLGVREGGEVAL